MCHVNNETPPVSNYIKVYLYRVKRTLSREGLLLVYGSDRPVHPRSPTETRLIFTDRIDQYNECENDNPPGNSGGYSV